MKTKFSPIQERALEALRKHRSNSTLKSAPLSGWSSPYELGVSEATLNVLLRYDLVEWQYCPDGSGRIEWRAKEINDES